MLGLICSKSVLWSVWGDAVPVGASWRGLFRVVCSILQHGSVDLYPTDSMQGEQLCLNFIRV